MAKAYDDATFYEGDVVVGPVGGPHVQRDYFRNGLAAVFFLQDYVFDAGQALVWDGDIPAPPATPAGAVI